MQVSCTTDAAKYVDRRSVPARASRRLAERRPELRRRLVPGSVERPRDKPQHHRPKAARQRRPLRQTVLSLPQPDRDYVRQIEGLEELRNTLRKMRQDLPTRRCIGRNRPVLALRINRSGAWADVRGAGLGVLERTWSAHPNRLSADRLPTSKFAQTTPYRKVFANANCH